MTLAKLCSPRVTDHLLPASALYPFPTDIHFSLVNNVYVMCFINIVFNVHKFFFITFIVGIIFIWFLLISIYHVYNFYIMFFLDNNFYV